ncbi:MAG: AAA family ATPase [Deltaproteobacteria bacterium]|nr:AAA family ATPase [Deltaproteobacteria bacterium]
MDLHFETPVLKYWGFKEDPFEDFILQGESLRLFVCRHYELHRLHNALNTRCIGVYGTHGVGKSSFLRKFEKKIKHTGLVVAYVRLAGSTEKALYREILAAILQCHSEKKIKTGKEFKLNSREESKRVDSSIRVAKELECGAVSVMKAGVKQAKEILSAPHDEDSARLLISKIIANTKTAFVVIVDDLERMEYFLKNRISYARFIAGFVRTVGDLFSRQGVAFVVSLDKGFVDQIGHKMPHDEGEALFSFEELVELPNFLPQELADMIRKRLNDRKWGKTLGDFISPDAFWGLMLATGGHPRKGFGVLRMAMQYVEMRKKPRKLDMESIKEGLKGRPDSIDDKDLTIVQFLSIPGSHSASDKDFQKAVGLGRTSLLNRLQALTYRLGLEVAAERIGTTTKDVYSLPEIKFYV